MATYVVPLTAGGQEASMAAMAALSGAYKITNKAGYGGYYIVSSDTSPARARSPSASSASSHEVHEKHKQSAESSEGEWVQMAVPHSDEEQIPALSVTPQEVAKEKL